LSIPADAAMALIRSRKCGWRFKKSGGTGLVAEQRPDVTSQILVIATSVLEVSIPVVG
jgi:hypothetical protein